MITKMGNYAAGDNKKLPDLVPMKNAGSVQSIQFVDESVDGSRNEPKISQSFHEHGDGSDSLPMLVDIPEAEQQKQYQLYDSTFETEFRNLRVSALNELQPTSEDETSTLVKTKRKRNDKNRFILSKATKDEFGLKDSDVPMSMRQKLDDSYHYTNHVDQNIRVVKRFNDINKVVFLSKIKFNIENELSRMQRLEQK